MALEPPIPCLSKSSSKLLLFPGLKDPATERENIVQQITTLKNDTDKLISYTFPKLPRLVNIYSRTMPYAL